MWCRLTGRVWRTIEEVLGREAQGIARGLGRGPSDGEPGDAGLATCFSESCPLSTKAFSCVSSRMLSTENQSQPGACRAVLSPLTEILLLSLGGSPIVDLGVRMLVLFSLI